MTFIREIQISTAQGAVSGQLNIPDKSQAVVLFAHGSGSGRHSPRNRFVAEQLQTAGLSTLLLDLLTSREETVDELTGHLRFNIELLAQRVSLAIEWLQIDAATKNMKIGLFGASTGSAAALMAAAQHPEEVSAIVSRGGRPDLAVDYLALVEAPTLLLVGQSDTTVLGLNRFALNELRCPKQLKIIPGATHLFEEPGALDQVAAQAAIWLNKYLNPAAFFGGEPIIVK